MFYMYVGKDILIGSETLLFLISLSHFFGRQGKLEVLLKDGSFW